MENLKHQSSPHNPLHSQTLSCRNSLKFLAELPLHFYLGLKNQQGFQSNSHFTQYRYLKKLGIHQMSI